MAELTFRDFAGAITGGNAARGAEVLEELLALDNPGAAAATAHFQASMASDPAFMGKAMSLRTAVTGGSDQDITALLRDCFGLQGGALPRAVAALRLKYPA